MLLAVSVEDGNLTWLQTLGKAVFRVPMAVAYPDMWASWNQNGDDDQDQEETIPRDRFRPTSTYRPRLGAFRPQLG